MASVQTVVVHGATGLQGSSVSRHLAKLGFSVRAVVRDPSSANAQALLETPGITLAHVPDLLDRIALRAVYAGADFVFGCTMINPDEEKQGKTMADVALEARVKLFAWSSLESIATASEDRIPAVPGFDGKANVAAYMKKIGLPVVILLAGGFFENFVRMPGLLTINSAGEIDVRYFMFGDDDHMLGCLWTGKDLPRMVEIILKHPDAFRGQDIVAAPTPLSLGLVAQRIEAITGRKARAHNDPIPDELPGLGPFAEDLKNVARYARDKTIVKLKGLPRIDPQLTAFGFEPASFDDFVTEEVVPFLKL